MTENILVGLACFLLARLALISPRGSFSRGPSGSLGVHPLRYCGANHVMLRICSVFNPTIYLFLRFIPEPSGPGYNPMLPAVTSLFESPTERCDNGGQISPQRSVSVTMAPSNLLRSHQFVSSYSQTSPAPGNKFPLTANIFPVTPAANPSTCLAYCSTCLLFNRVSSLPGSCGSLNSLCHSSSGNGLCFASALLAFSDLRFCCQLVIFVCSRASCLW